MNGMKMTMARGDDDAAQAGQEVGGDEHQASPQGGQAAEAGSGNRAPGGGDEPRKARSEAQELTNVTIETRVLNVKLEGRNVSVGEALWIFQTALTMVGKAEPRLESHNTGFQGENVGGIGVGETTMGFGLPTRPKHWYDDWKANDMLDHPDTWRRVRDSQQGEMEDV